MVYNLLIPFEEDSSIQENSPYQNAANNLLQSQKKFMEMFKNRPMPKNKAIRLFAKGSTYYESLRENLRLSALFTLFMDAFERNGYICDYSFCTVSGIPYIDVKSVTFPSGEIVFSGSQLPVATFLDLYHKVYFNGRELIYRVLNTFLDEFPSRTGWEFECKPDNDYYKHKFGKRDIVSLTFYGVKYDMTNDGLFWFVDQLCDGYL